MQPKAFKFGVEIECSLPRESVSTVVEALEDLGNNVGSDGSIHDLRVGYEGIELRTPPLGYNATTRLISKTCKLLEDYNVNGNATCGLHVHCSNRKFLMAKYLKRIVHTWLAVEDVLTATQPQSRFNNNYCVRLLREFVRGTLDNLPHDKDLILRKIETEHQIAHGSRYYALNLMALNAHKTLECRLHAYTANAQKINSWITVLRGLYNYAIEGYDPIVVDHLFKTPISMEKIEEVWTLFGIPDKVKAFYSHKITRNLFSLLASQQEGAYKRMGLVDAKTKAMNRYNTANQELENIRTQEREATRAFSS